MASKAAVLAFSDGSFVPRTTSGMRDGMMCKEVDGERSTNDASRLNRSCETVVSIYLCGPQNIESPSLQQE